MKYFDYDPNFDVLTPKDKRWSWYWFPADELHYYYPDGKHLWFPHLAKKIWFTQDHFWELLEYAQKRFPEVDFSKAVWQAAWHFHERYVSENFERYEMIYGKDKNG